MAASDRRGQKEDEIKRFDPRILDRSVIAIPLLEEINRDDNELHAVIIDVNLDYDEGREAGRKWIREAIQNAVDIIAPDDKRQGVQGKKTDLSNQYIFARLTGKVIREVVRLDHPLGMIGGEALRDETGMTAFVQARFVEADGAGAHRTGGRLRHQRDHARTVDPARQEGAQRHIGDHPADNALAHPGQQPFAQLRG